MSKLADFFAGAPSPAVIAGVTIQTGETIVPGDQVALDYQGKAIKCSAGTSIVGLDNAQSLSVAAIIDFTVTLTVVVVYGNANTYLIFYNRSTNTVLATPSIAGTPSLVDARILPNTEIVFLGNNGSNQQVIAKFTSAGAQVGATTVTASLATFQNGGTYNTIAPSPVAGEFFIGEYLVTSVDFQIRHFNTSLVQQGIASGPAGGGNASGMGQPTLNCAGASHIAFTTANGGNGYAGTAVFHATTRALTGSVITAFVISNSTATLNSLTWDATNAQFVYWANVTGSPLNMWKLTTAGVFTPLVVPNAGTLQYAAMLPSMTAAVGIVSSPGAGAYHAVFEYTSASGGTVTARRLQSKSSHYILDGTVGSLVIVPNFAAQGPGGCSAGMVSPYLRMAITNVAGGANYHHYTVDQSTGVITPLFTHTGPHPTTPIVAARAWRYAYAITDDNYGPSLRRVMIRRADSGVVYGTAKKVQGSLVDIDTSVLGAVADTGIMPVRGRSEVVTPAGNFYIGG